jgi:hypothetical protein
VCDCMSCLLCMLLNVVKKGVGKRSDRGGRNGVANVRVGWVLTRKAVAFEL